MFFIILCFTVTFSAQDTIKKKIVMIDKEKEELIVMWEIGFDRNQPICFRSNRDVQKEERKKKTINDIRYNE